MTKAPPDGRASQQRGEGRAHHQITMLRLAPVHRHQLCAKASQSANVLWTISVGGAQSGYARRPEADWAPPVHEVVVLRLLDLELVALRSNLWEISGRVSLSDAETFVTLNAIEPTRSRQERRVDGVGRPKFDFHTGSNC